MLWRLIKLDANDKLAGILIKSRTTGRNPANLFEIKNGYGCHKK